MINDIIDIGCSVGISTRYLAETFPSAKVTVRTNPLSEDSLEIVTKQFVHSMSFGFSYRGWICHRTFSL